MVEEARVAVEKMVLAIMYIDDVHLNWFNPFSNLFWFIQNYVLIITKI